jgi:HD-like signal output (HDOD) protein
MNEQHVLEQKALESVAEGFRLNAMKLPSLPEATEQIRAIGSDPEATVEDLARAILRDPALTARLLRVANSPLLRGRMEVRTLPQAITRLGFYYVRDLVTALALEHSFQPRTQSIRQLQHQIGQSSRNVAAVAQVLARHCTGLAPERAMLAGLLHFIGALPLLVAIEEQRLEGLAPSTILGLIERRHADIGASLLRQWHFPEDIASVPEACGRTSEDGADPALADVITVAILLARPLDAPSQPPPELEGLAAARKLGLGKAAEFYQSDAMQIDLDKCRGLLN